MDLLAELSPEEVKTFASICHHDNHHDNHHETVITIILTIFISSIIRYLSLRCLPFPNLIRGKRVRYLIIVTKTATAHHLKHHHHDFHSHPHHCHQCNHQHWPAIFKFNSTKFSALLAIPSISYLHILHPSSPTSTQSSLLPLSSSVGIRIVKLHLIQKVHK